MILTVFLILINAFEHYVRVTILCYFIFMLDQLWFTLS